MLGVEMGTDTSFYAYAGGVRYLVGFREKLCKIMLGC